MIVNHLNLFCFYGSKKCVTHIMKKLLRLFVIAILLTSTINAQERKERTGKRADFTPEQIAELHTKKNDIKF